MQVEDGWFITLRSGDPAAGLMVSEEAARLIGAAGALLVACKVARSVIEQCHCADSKTDEPSQMLAESALTHLEAAIQLAEGP